MKILHGHVGSDIRVHVDDKNATPETPMGLTTERIPTPVGIEYVEDFGWFASHGDSSFAVDPDGTLYVYGDMSKPAHHSYGRNAWLWVGDENNNGAFNTAHDPAAV
jgi:hypothetical protein